MNLRKLHQPNTAVRMN